jgi:hypothetical protein
MKDDRFECSGPDLGNLKHLHEILPSFSEGMVKKQTFGKGHKSPLAKLKENPPKPTKLCEVCSLLFAFKTGFDGQIQSAVCADCQKQLDAGLIALVSDDRYAFGSSSTLPDMAGKIVQIKKETMDEIEKQKKSMKKSHDGNQS